MLRELNGETCCAICCAERRKSYTCKTTSTYIQIEPRITRSRARFYMTIEPFDCASQSLSQARYLSACGFYFGLRSIRLVPLLQTVIVIFHFSVGSIDLCTQNSTTLLRPVAFGAHALEHTLSDLNQINLCSAFCRRRRRRRRGRTCCSGTPSLARLAIRLVAWPFASESRATERTSKGQNRSSDNLNIINLFRRCRRRRVDATLAIAAKRSLRIKPRDEIQCNGPPKTRSSNAMMIMTLTQRRATGAQPNYATKVSFGHEHFLARARARSISNQRWRLIINSSPASISSLADCTTLLPLLKTFAAVSVRALPRDRYASSLSLKCKLQFCGNELLV